MAPAEQLPGGAPPPTDGVQAPAGWEPAGLVNGFRAVPELEAFECDEGSIAPFTLPVEALTFEPTAEMVVTTFRNGDRERKIHCNIELERDEQEQLYALQREAAAQGAKFFPSISAMATRYLSHARSDHKKALRLMQATQEWRRKYFQDGPIRQCEVEEDLKHGIVYFCGRDAALRPALVVRGNRIPQQWYKEKSVHKLIRVLIFSMEYMQRYMLVPGRVESLTVVVDLQGLGLSQVPISALGEVYKVMSHHYIGRVHRFYVCNLPTSLSMISGMAKSLLTDRQRQKLVVLGDVKELLRDFAPGQLEADLGGCRPKFAAFFPYPLTDGPFASGEPALPASSRSRSVPDVHRLLSRAGSRGRLWDPRRSRRDNLKLEYCPRAADVLERCGLPGPEAEAKPCRRGDAPAEPSPRKDVATRPEDADAEDKPWIHRASTTSTDEGTARATDESSSSRGCEDFDGDVIETIGHKVELEGGCVSLQCHLFSLRPCGL